MSEKIKINETVEGNSAGAIAGKLTMPPGLAEEAESILATKREIAKAETVTEAKAILARYRPETGTGASLNEPSQGEAQRMLDCIQGLYAMIQAPSVPRVDHQEVALKTR